MRFPSQALGAWSQQRHDVTAVERGNSSGTDEECSGVRPRDLSVGTDAMPELVLQDMVQYLLPDVASHSRAQASVAAMRAGLLEDVAVSPMKRGRSDALARGLDDEEETVSKRSRHDVAVDEDWHGEVTNAVDEIPQDGSDQHSSTELSGADAAVAAARNESEEAKRFTAQLEQWGLDSETPVPQRPMLAVSVSVDERRSPGAGGDSLLQAAAAAVKASRLEEQGFEAQLARHL